MPIPLYSSQFALLDFIGRRHALRLERNGLAKVIRHKKTGAINRVVLYLRDADPHPTSVRDYQGQAYSFEQPLNDGHRCWKLRPLQGGRSDSTLAPPELRPIFLEGGSRLPGSGDRVMCPQCGSDNIRIEEYDFGTCRETGYRDAGEVFICRACGAKGDADELVIANEEDAACNSSSVGSSLADDFWG